MLDIRVIVRGAGEMAGGVGLSLYRSGFKVGFTEIAEPLCVRRLVSFSEAVYYGETSVEGVKAVLVKSPKGIEEAWSRPTPFVLIDPNLDCLEQLNPDVLVDATLAKRSLGLNKDMADLVIALGPGFTAGRHAHVVVETNRGHNLGRLIDQGEAEPNTGVPGNIAGQTAQRVLRAPAAGVVRSDLDIKARVVKGQPVMEIGGETVLAGLDGVLRGLIHPGTWVRAGLKVGDIDPRNKPEYCETVSDKARALGGAVLEAILRRYNRSIAK